MRSPGKVFGIGLSKTGTTSLHQAFELLGMRAVHYPAAHAMLANDWSEIEAHDAASDISVSVVFRELDQAFPGSRFILTVRDIDPWLSSMARHFGPMVNRPENSSELEVFARANGHLKRFDRDAMIHAWEAHVAGVMAYFERREDDLLVLDVCGGSGWEPLCRFLAVGVPAQPFPRENVTATADRAG